jgi:diguanylate cyclase (GGDEF)-like protein
MISSWIKPATFLMNKLGFRIKFILILSLFALPLGLLIFNTMDNLDKALKNNEAQHIQLDHIRQITILIRRLENFRDLHTLNFLSPSTRFQAGYSAAKDGVMQEFNLLEHNLNKTKYAQSIKHLKNQINALKIAPGMEAVRAQYVYQNTNQLVSTAYAIRTSMINLSGLFNNPDDRIALLANLVANDMQNVFQAMGAARVYGTFYLTQNYINSNGVDVLDNTYNQLSSLINALDNSMSEFQTLFTAGFPILSHPPVVDILKNIRHDLDKDLIQSLSLNTSPDQYFDTVSNEIDKNSKFLSRIFDVQAFLLQQQRNKQQVQLKIYLAIIIIITCTFIYLFLGFAISLKENIYALIDAAYQVSQGKFDHKIKLNVQDELKYLASSMNTMRHELSIRETQLKELISTDGLTELKNRKFFDENLEIDLARCSRINQPLSLILMDIDHFKQVNDNYGHPAGDECLRVISREIKRQFQRKSDCCARYGGEEFAIILPNTNLEQSLNLAEIFRKTVQRLNIDITTTKLKITISLGVSSCIPASHFPPQALIAAADSALYQAKNNGRNQSCTRDMNSHHGDLS